MTIINFTHFVFLFNAAIGELKVTHVVCIVFLVGSTGLVKERTCDKPP